VIDSDSSTEQEKIIANAIMNIQHQTTAEDQQKLQQIIDGTAPTSTVSTLASIVQSFSHGISKTDKRKLQTIKFKG
jgi:ribosomal protein S7